MLYLEKAEEPEIKLPKSVGSYKKQRNFLKIYFCFIDYAKAFYCVDHNKLWKILKEMGIPDHLTCLLRNLYVSQEATVRTLYGNGNPNPICLPRESHGQMNLVGYSSWSNKELHDWATNTHMGQLIGSGLRKYDSPVYCHPVCLIYMLNTSWEMPGWMSYKLEST